MFGISTCSMQGMSLQEASAAKHPRGAAALSLKGPSGGAQVCLTVSASCDKGQALLPLHVHVIHHITHHPPGSHAMLI